MKLTFGSLFSEVLGRPSGDRCEDGEVGSVKMSRNTEAVCLDTVIGHVEDEQVMNISAGIIVQGNWSSIRYRVTEAVCLDTVIGHVEG